MASQAPDPQLMEMMLSTLMDPNIDANDVGSQLMQAIAQDALTGGQRGGGTQQGVSAFLRGILQNMAAEQQPSQGQQK